MASTDELIKAAFDSAVQKFKVDLDNEKAIEEISKTQSIEDVYKATEELQEEQGKRNGLRNLAKIQPLLEGLRNYAKVIEVFVGAKQNVLSLIWGPIKLLLHWTNNLKQHFDAVVNVLAEIGHLLPEFQRAMDIFSQNVYIKEVLVLFFQDILNFYLIVLKFFNHSYLKIVFEAMWPKQRERILVVKTQMENHSLLLRHEVKFEHIQEAHNAQLKAIEHYDKVEKSLRRQEYKSIKADISPLIYDERLDSITSLTCLGTEAWLLNHPIFKKWLKSKIVSSNFLWLKGIPGSGKTYISSSIVHKMKNDGLRTIYAFMSYTHSSILTALSVLHSLIFQLASGSEALEVLVNELSGQDLKSSFQAATDILKVLLPCVGPTCIVLDGVDEIKDMERRRLLKRLIEVCDCFDTVKIIISSREEADIETILKSFASISIDSNNAGGIQMFVHQKTENWLQEREFLPAAGVEIRELLKPLSSKAKGMFLYAKIVLDNVEYCDSIEQIRRELRVLPESLDDAYSRILHRINSSPEPLKLKARKILGWIGCAPTPMTVQEIEQALVVSSEGVDGHAQVIHAENLRRACGPIVEVVDEYVQFVHFTVQEYLFCSSIRGHLDRADAVLDLAGLCVTYICQVHHNHNLQPQDIRQNVLSGTYRLHDFATTRWLDLVKECIKLSKNQRLSARLIEILHRLLFIRSKCDNEHADLPKGLPEYPYIDLDPLKSTNTTLYDLLCKAEAFHLWVMDNDFDKSKDIEWTDSDPFTLSSTSLRIFHQFTDVCQKVTIDSSDELQTLKMHYGPRLFKCGLLSCPLHRYGFEASSLLSAHTKLHNIPWKCSYSDCKFSNGGFLSRKMRDLHHNSHITTSGHDSLRLEKEAADDNYSLFMDLVKADKVDHAKDLINQFTLFEFKFSGAARHLFSFGSVAMVDLVISRLGWLTESRYEPKENPIKWSLKAGKNDVVAHLFSISSASSDPWISHCYLSCLPTLLEIESEELFEKWLSTLLRVEQFDKSEHKSQSKRIEEIWRYITDARTVKATRRQIGGEDMLISSWRKVYDGTKIAQNALGRALRHVAQTTCSIRLAMYLINRGVKVDHTWSKVSLTPLCAAAQRSSFANAEMMEYLLNQGADPEYQSEKILPYRGTGLGTRGHNKVQIKDQIGAKEIAKWLGRSWDEVVENARRSREERKAETEAASRGQEVL